MSRTKTRGVGIKDGVAIVTEADITHAMKMLDQMRKYQHATDAQCEHLFRVLAGLALERSFPETPDGPSGPAVSAANHPSEGDPR